MTEQNGIKIYDKEETPELPAGLTAPGDFGKDSPFGIKAVTVDGKPIWQLATEDDYCKSESTRLGVSEDEIRNRVRSRGRNPGDCAGNGFWCDGNCYYPNYSCKSMHDGGGHYYCGCTNL